MDGIIVTALTLTLFALLITGGRRLQRGRAKDRAERERMHAAETAEMPVGTVILSDQDAQVHQSDRSGRIMLIFSGSFSANLGVRLLTLLAACGIEGCIGSILLIEMDSRRREVFLANVPVVFHSRLVCIDVPSMAGGLGNRTVAEVDNHIDRWGPAVLRATSDVCERHQRLQRGEEPALGLVFVSQGAHAALGVTAVEAVRRQFPLTQFYGFTALPVDERLRRQAKLVLARYQGVGVHGFVVGDNLADEVRNDFGMIAAIAGFAAAAEHADAAIEQNNAWRQLFTQDPGGLVRYSTYVHNIPGYALQPSHPKVPPRYFIYKSSAVSAILTGLTEAHRAEHDSLAGVGGCELVPLTSRFDIALAAIVPGDLKEDEDDVVLGQLLNGRNKRNYHLLFAPIKALVDPARPLCPIAVVSLQAVHDPSATLDELTAPVAMPELPEPLHNGAHAMAGRSNNAR